MPTPNRCVRLTDEEYARCRALGGVAVVVRRLLAFPTADEQLYEIDTIRRSEALAGHGRYMNLTPLMFVQALIKEREEKS